MNKWKFFCLIFFYYYMGRRAHVENLRALTARTVAGTLCTQWSNLSDSHVGFFAGAVRLMLLVA